MSDDLIERLMLNSPVVTQDHMDAATEIMPQAAARIRELEAKVERLRGDGRLGMYGEYTPITVRSESILDDQPTRPAPVSVQELRSHISRLTAAGDAFAAYMHPKDDEARGSHMRAYRKWEAAKQDALSALAGGE